MDWSKAVVQSTVVIAELLWLRLHNRNCVSNRDRQRAQQQQEGERKARAQRMRMGRRARAQGKEKEKKLLQVHGTI